MTITKPKRGRRPQGPYVKATFFVRAIDRTMLDSLAEENEASPSAALRHILDWYRKAAGKA